MTNSFSKPMKPKNLALTYTEYYEKRVSLKIYKVPELKIIARNNRLHVSGNKTVLMERIQERFMQMVKVTKIQSAYRGHLIRKSFRLRGDAFKKRGMCVNDSDFVTLEPLSEIPFQLFFSYKDDKDFIYGFNIESLIQVLKTKGRLENPYNRELMSIQVLDSVISLHNINNIVFPAESDSIQIVLEKPRTRVAIQETGFNHLLSPYYFEPRLRIALNTNTLIANHQKLLEMRAKSVQVRIQQLFMEIDQLGNYTQSTWFSNLDRARYLRFYRCLIDIWGYRGQLSAEVRQNICPLFDPFSNIFTSPMHQGDISLEQMKFLCLTIMENMIYTGVDIEYRKLGALHVLSALTLVSQSARIALPWLYESLV